MDMNRIFEQYWNEDEQAVFSRLTTPAEIQAFLDSVPYSPEERNRSPLSVLRDRQAHCLDGGLFAAAALRRLGHLPVIIDLLPEPGQDDDHVLAIFKQHGRFGAVAKSNFSGLRFREPVYQNLRELVMSYFEFFFNVNGQKTLRAYTARLYLEEYDHLNWMWSDAHLDEIEQRLSRLRRFSLLDAETVAFLSPADPLTYQAGMLGVNEAGLYKPIG